MSLTLAGSSLVALMGGAPPVPFPTIANMTMRLRSDLDLVVSGSDLVTWTSQGGATSTTGAPIFVQPSHTAPTLVAAQVNGQPCVRFNGTTQDLQMGSPASGSSVNGGRFGMGDIFGGTGAGGVTGDYSIFAVWKNKATAAPSGLTYGNPAMLNTGFAWECFYGTNSTIGAEIFADPAASIATSGGGLIYSEYTKDAARSSPRGLLRLGVGGSTSTMVGANVANNAAFTLGFNTFTSLYLQMDLFELVTYSRALTGGEITSLGAYFNSFWGPGL